MNLETFIEETKWQSGWEDSEKQEKINWLLNEKKDLQIELDKSRSSIEK